MKKWIALCLIGIMMVSFCACKGKDADSKDAEVSSEIKDDQMVDTSDNETNQPSDESSMPDDVPANEAEQSGESANNKKAHNHIHIKVGTVYENEYSDAYNTTLAQIEYPVVKLEECCEEAFEELEDAIDDLNEDERASVRNQFWDMIDSAKEQLSEGYEFYMANEVTEDVSVRRADSVVLSLLYDGYTYLGGAHGMEYYWAKNFDVKTGKELLLSDVVNDMSLLPNIAKAEMEQYIDADALFGTYEEVAQYISDQGDNLTWTLDYNGLSLYFDPYEIGSYAAGPQTVTMSFAEYPNLIKQEYQQVPESYTMQMSTDLPTYYDVNGDGQLDAISAWGLTEDGYGYTKHCIQINDQQYKYETWSYELDPLLVHTKDGNNYLYIQDSSDNDYRTISIYKLSGSGVESLGYINNGWHGEYVEDKEYWGLEQVLTDPQQFKLDTRTDMLSTSSAYKNYIINENGVPASKDPYYFISYTMRFTSLMPLPVELVDKNTNETIGHTTVNKGDVVTYYGTDDKNTAYLKLSDGSIAKVIVNVESWPNLVNGIPVEEQFDGVMWAG